MQRCSTRTWRIIERVRKIVNEFGLPPTRFDPLQERPPPSYMPAFIVTRLESYIAEPSLGQCSGMSLELSGIAERQVDGFVERQLAPEPERRV